MSTFDASIAMKLDAHLLGCSSTFGHDSETASRMQTNSDSVNHRRPAETNIIRRRGGGENEAMTSLGTSSTLQSQNDATQSATTAERQQLLLLLLLCEVADYVDVAAVSLDESGTSTTRMIGRLTQTALERIDGVDKESKSSLMSSFDQLLVRCRSVVASASRRQSRRTKSGTKVDGGRTGTDVDVSPSGLHADVWMMLSEVCSAALMTTLNTDRRRNRDVEQVASCVLTGIIIWRESTRFDQLMTSICGDGDDNEDRDLELVVLDAVLGCSELVVDYDGDLTLRRRLVDVPLAFGDTPLTRAARARRHDVIAVLLRHGAGDVTDAISAVLFSPNLVVARLESDMDVDGRRCLLLLLAAVPRLPVDRLNALETDGYHPLCRRWRDVMRDAVGDAWCSPVDAAGRLPVAPLQQLARCAVRASVGNEMSNSFDVGGLSFIKRIDELPVPTCIKEFILLQDTD